MFEEKRLFANKTLCSVESSFSYVSLVIKRLIWDNDLSISDFESFVCSQIQENEYSITEDGDLIDPKTGEVLLASW